MPTLKSDYLREMESRGFIHQCSDLEGLDARLARETVTAYVGYDCTATSLHVGNLVSIMMLHWFQKTGHRPIVLMGGGTTRVGDPSGKDAQRQLRGAEEIETNKAAIRKNFAPFIRFGDGPSDAMMIDNADWLLELQYVDFLRDVGRHFSVNRMLTMDSVRLRLDREQPLSFLEFNYMVLQAYDFVELYRRHGCRLQMGGSDQWGNIVSGIDLGRRMEEAELFALTTPLITTASGAKMGKTAEGAVWLSPDLKSPYDYWQFWRNTEDADVGRFLKLFTTLPLDEIARLEALDGAELNDAKKVLATEATALLHGRDAAERAAEAAKNVFGSGFDSSASGGALGSSLPTMEITPAQLETGYGILTANVDLKFASSNSDARRHVSGGAVKLNDVKIVDPRYQLTSYDFDADGNARIQLGQKKHGIIRLNAA